MINSTARGFNPHFEKAYDCLKYVCDKYPDQLEFVSLDCEEMKDEFGNAYQVVPKIRISFK